VIGKVIPLALIVTFAGSLAQAAAPAEGSWRTDSDNAVVRISACGDAICGYLVTSDRLKSHPDQTDARNRNVRLRTRTLAGMALFYGLKGGPTEWSGGSLYNPADGKTYHGSIRLTGADTLKLTGCVFGPFCKSETWSRIR